MTTPWLPEERPFRTALRAPACLIAACLTLAAVATASCRPDPARPEAATLVRVIGELREAPNPAKRGPLERLRAMPCSFPDICAARDACVDAFQHHVRGVELGTALDASLDASAPDQDAAADLAMRLLEMNVEVEEGKARMPLCEERIAGVRVAHKI